MKRSQHSKLECSVCCKRFDAEKHQPKLVPCGHTFCLRCLQQIAARDGVNASCPEDGEMIDTIDVRDLRDNKFITSWLEELKAGQQTEASVAEPPHGELLQGLAKRYRDTLVQEMQRQVSATMSTEQQLEAGISASRLAQLDQEFRLLNSAETVNMTSSSWRAEGVNLQKQPALRIAMLLLLHNGELRERSQLRRLQHQEVSGLLVELDVGPYCNCGPYQRTEQKAAVLSCDIPVQKIKGVSWDEDAAWVRSLLTRHGGTLQEMDVYLDCSSANPAADLAALPELRKLVVRWCNPGLSIPERWLGRLLSLDVCRQECDERAVLQLLRAHRGSLQEVHLEQVNQEQLLELQRMPELRELSVKGVSADVTEDPALCEPWRGKLHSLEVRSSPLQAAVVSLLKSLFATPCRSISVTTVCLPSRAAWRIGPTPAATCLHCSSTATLSSDITVSSAGPSWKR